MSKAVDICVFVLLLNASIAAVGMMGMYEDAGVAGTDPGHLNPTNQSVNPLDVLISGGNILAALSAIGIGVAAKILGFSVGRAIGVSIFTGVFWSSWGTASAILEYSWFPSAMSALITLIYGVVFTVALVQILTGTRI